MFLIWWFIIWHSKLIWWIKTKVFKCIVCHSQSYSRSWSTSRFTRLLPRSVGTSSTLRWSSSRCRPRTWRWFYLLRLRLFLSLLKSVLCAIQPHCIQVVDARKLCYILWWKVEPHFVINDSNRLLLRGLWRLYLFLSWLLFNRVPFLILLRTLQPLIIFLIAFLCSLIWIHSILIFELFCNLNTRQLIRALLCCSVFGSDKRGDCFLPSCGLGLFLF